MNNDVKVKVNLSWPSIICIMLQFLFLTLKLCGVIAWSWVCVFIPLIVMGGLIVLDIILLIILYVIWRRNQ